MKVGKHYVQTGDYWPVRVEAGQPLEQRFGVMQLQGYPIAPGLARTGPKWFTSFHVCDLTRDAEVVGSFRAQGKPGEDRVQWARQQACEYADQLNAEEREAVAA